MRVLYLLASNVIGGVETCVFELACEMSKVGIQPYISFLRKVPKWETTFISGELKKFHIPVFFHDVTPIPYLIVKQKFDIIHFHRPAHALDCAKYLRLAGWDGVTIVTCQGADAISDARHLSQLPFTPDYITAISEYLLHHVRPVFGDKVPTKLVYTGIDFSRFYPGEHLDNIPEQPIIGWVGHTTGIVKNLAGLMAIAVTMPDEYKFWVASSTEHPYVNDLIGWSRGKVQFLSRQTYLEMPNFYRQIAASGGCLLITSHTEGLCLAAIEAIACGCPVVAPRVGALPEVVKDGVGGFLYSHERALDEVPLLIEKLRDPNIRKEVINKGLKHVRSKFSLQQMIDNYLNVYEEALNKHKLKCANFSAQIKNHVKRLFTLSSPFIRHLRRLL